MAEAVSKENAPPAYTFPTSFRSSVLHWWNALGRNASEASEEALVRRGLGNDVPLVAESEAQQESFGKRAFLKQFKLKGHPASDTRYYINTLEIGDYKKSDDEQVILTLHGYGNGLAFYWQNFKAFLVPNSRVIFADHLGMGRSGRPTFPSIKQKGESEEAVRERVKTAENFFLDSLDQLRQHAAGDKPVTLVGHSIGGYLAAAYALKYPQFVNKLILISPVGVPKSPYASASSRPSTPAPASSKDGSKEGADPPAELDAASLSQPEPEPQKPPSGLWVKLWEANVSPFSLIRISTIFGPQLISRYASRRFSLFPPDVQEELFNYLYQISNARGSGEYALAHLLAPGAYARWPLVERMGALRIPCTFIYGDHDWMDEKGGRKALELLKNTELQRRRSKLLINQHSGHWVHLENPEGFNKMLKKELEDAVNDAREQAKASS